MKIGFLQYKPEFGQSRWNLDRIAELLEPVEADIIVLPELAVTGYLFTNSREVEELSEPLDGPGIAALKRIAEEKNMYIAAGWAERTPAAIYNSAVLVHPEKTDRLKADGVQVYRKMHLFADEKDNFKTGDLGFPVFNLETPSGETVKVGMLVCFDHMFPEAARILALKGAQIILHPSNLVLAGYAQLTSRVRAMENKVFWVLANRTGTEERGGKKLTYTGLSQVVSPKGDVLVQAGQDEECVKIIDINPGESLNKNITEVNHVFGDRRIDYYGDLTLHTRD
jgi:predicted amidohydrolase